MRKKHWKRLAAIEKEQRVMDLRRKGYSFAMIAKTINTSEAEASRLYQQGFSRALKLHQETAQENIRIDLARLDECIRAVWEAVIEDPAGQEPGVTVREKLEGIDRLVKLLERRARMLGLDAPEKRVEVSMGMDLGSMSDEELRAEMEKMGLVLESDRKSIPLDYVLPGEIVVEKKEPESWKQEGP